MIEIAGDVRRLGIAEDAFELLFGGTLHRAVDLILAGRALGHKFEIDHRDIRRRHADRNTVEPAGKFGQDEADGFCGAGRGRNDVERGGACPIQILVHLIERWLIVGIGVHRRHETFVDADRVIENFDHRDETIGRARSVGHDCVRFRELVVIDAVNDCEVGAVGRRRDQDALGAGLQMRRRFVF